ncbi:hypothetical protein FHS82_000740 [Pseudochelatococcus lubricantis]|uniref:Uncharacterized protein n=1 Tax=Pseudochelatococcus lubricantis TaxID=1538102 RepID=A0ABX0UVE4_9HYPH|nr:hypothetical protein [Pseudochelatococcus lubricantis]NIJ56927.1 hypothetical protein [Pseudochelatococcus lubricantis]
MLSKRFKPPVTQPQLVKATQTAQAAATTIAFRLPQFLYDTLDPTHPMSAETQRAFSEKAAAAMEGSLIAAQAWQRLWIDMAFGRVGPGDLPHKLMKIADESANPARRRVRANAKRLTAKHLQGK